MSAALSLADLRDVGQADVVKAGRQAGRLERAGNDVVFRYDPGYCADPAAPPVATTLPKSVDPVVATGGSVPPFFAGLLPEGLRLTAVTAAARTSADDHLTVLLAIGADAIGDIQVVPAGVAPTDPEPVLAVEVPGLFDFRAVFANATSSDPAVFDRVGLPGVQVKVSARMISTPIVTMAGPAILKLNPPADPRLVENEHFFLRMAGACGIRVPEHRLIHDRNGESALVVARFDRDVMAGGVRRLAQEDACQVLGRYPAAKYRVTLEDVVRALAAVVATGGGSPALTIRRALEIAAFSYLVGNGDLHAKNLSVRANRDGVWELTPAYDLLTTQPYLGWRDPMALRLYGRDNKLGLRWWRDAATRLGIPERAITRAIERIVHAAGPWLDRLGEIGFNDRTTARLRDLIATRRRELAG